MAKEAPSAGESIKLQIKFGGETISISVSPESTLDELKSSLQSSTNVLPRGQKLIHKGKVLEGSGTLKSLGIAKGSKIMLMASQGLHQGDGPKLKDAPVRSNYQKVIANSDLKLNKKPVGEVPVEKGRLNRWKVTGVVALSECHLKDIPEEVWDCGSACRVLDLSNNYICNVPSKIRCLTTIQKLMLNANELSDDSICWEGLGFLKSLTFLSLNQNQLTTLPAALGALTSLTQLHLVNNKLSILPDEIGALTRLEILKLNNNRISKISTNIGKCQSLAEVDLSSNLLVELPETFCNLTNLKALHLRNNGTKALPSALLKKCIKLSTLDLHGTEITIDMLRAAEGWDEFDERRCLKHQKQLDFRAGGSANFDEGADKN
ncbi:hypothetical protein V2J09_019031 [Rumex salicifolius]